MSVTTSNPGQGLTDPPSYQSQILKALWNALNQTSNKAKKIYITIPEGRKLDLTDGLRVGFPGYSYLWLQMCKHVATRYVYRKVKIDILYAGGHDDTTYAMRSFIGLCQSFGREVCHGASVQCILLNPSNPGEYKAPLPCFNLADMMPKEFKTADEHLRTENTAVMVSLVITGDDLAMAEPHANRRAHVEKRALDMLSDYHDYVDRYFDDLGVDAKIQHRRLEKKRPRVDVNVEQDR